MTASVGLHAVTLGVSDIARSISFYEDLGWRRSSISTPNMAVLTAGAPAALILHDLQDLLFGASVSPEHGKRGFGGVALVMFVTSPEEVHRTLAKATRAGAKVLRPVTQIGWGSHAYFADRDGHTWEVLEAPGFEEHLA